MQLSHAIKSSEGKERCCMPNKHLQHWRRVLNSKEGNDMLVYVLNKHGQPLMPCKPRKARKLLEQGKSKGRSTNTVYDSIEIWIERLCPTCITWCRCRNEAYWTFRHNRRPCADLKVMLSYVPIFRNC